MIITNKTEGCLSIPMKDSMDMIHLVPGVQDVDNVTYAQALGTAKRLVAGGMITEEWVKIDLGNIKPGDYPETLIQECPDAKDKDKRMVPAKTGDIDRRSGDKLRLLIKECLHIPTLDKWERNELRSDVRLEILQQKQTIENPNKE